MLHAIPSSDLHISLHLSSLSGHPSSSWCSCSLVLVTLVTLFASHYFADENLGLEMYFTQVFP